MGVDGRRRFSWAMLIVSTIAMIINVGLYLAKIITTDDLILITLVLSWLAIIGNAVAALFVEVEAKAKES